MRSLEEQEEMEKGLEIFKKNEDIQVWGVHILKECIFQPSILSSSEA